MKEIYIVTNGSDCYADENTPDRAFTTYEAANDYAYNTIKELYDSTIQEGEEEDGENTLLISPKILETKVKTDNGYIADSDYVKEYTFTISDKYEHVKVTTTYYTRIYKINLCDE